MADANILREYLVKLGFKVDEAQQKKMQEGVKQLEKRLGELSKALAVVGTAVVVAVDRMSRRLDELYFASQRTKASAGNIRAFGYAVSQLGGTAEAATTSLENVARLLRESPGGEGLLTSIGVQTRKANGELRDMVDVFGDLGRQFQGMPYWQANAYAQALGIDERTLMAMRSGEMQKYMEDQRRLMKQLGVDTEEAAKAGRAYAQAMRELSAAAEGLGIKLQKYVLPVMREATEFMKRFAAFVDAPSKMVSDTKVVRDKGPLTNGPGVLDKMLPRWLVDWLNPGAFGAQHKVSGKVTAEPGSTDSAKLFANLERSFGLPPGILDRMWLQESGRGKNMRSPAGALGHFQFMPGTAKQYGLQDPNDLNASASAAARYLHDLLKMFGGDIQKAVAAYNWGPGNVQRQGLGAMPAETRGYVRNVAPPLQQTNDTKIYVQGSADLLATGQAVAAQQNRVAQDAARNFATVVR